MTNHDDQRKTLNIILRNPVKFSCGLLVAILLVVGIVVLVCCCCCGEHQQDWRPLVSPFQTYSVISTP